MRKRLLDVTVRRGVAVGISDHFFVECKVKHCVPKKYVNSDLSIFLDLGKKRSDVRNTRFFFYKNYFYKNHQAQILKN